ncbi:MAG: hypothetical protein ACTSQD_05975 [Promethearchaeota archaeon]
MVNFQDMFYILDLLVGFTAPILAYILYRTEKIDKFSWYVFWIGAAVGLTWEIPMFVGSYETNFFITLETIRPYPFHYIVFLISHTLWDGMLFIIGYRLVLLLSESPRFKEFNLKELMILIIYGQIQEIIVEVGSVSNSAWTFIVYWWNPALFYVNKYPITLYPQLAWLFGSILFYFILLKLRPKLTEKRTKS